MAPSEALCFSLLGVGLIIQLRRPKIRWLARILAEAVLILACAKLVEFALGLHFGIDAWFVRDPGGFGLVPTGRMAPVTAMNFVFMAIGFLPSLTVQPGDMQVASGLWARLSVGLFSLATRYGTPTALWRDNHSGRAFKRVRLFLLRNHYYQLLPAPMGGRCGRFLVARLARCFCAPLSRLSSPRQC